MVDLIFVATVVVAGITAAVYLIKAKADWTYAFAAVSMFFFFVSLILAKPIIKGGIYSEFSQGVNLTEVPLKGEKKFWAQIEITYKNGVIEEVTLVHQTMEPFALIPKRKKKA